MRLTEHAQRNRAHWDAWAPEWVEAGRRAWSQHEIAWGIWSIRESDLNVLDDPSGKDVLEAGCGTAYISAWLARLGARPVGLDNSPKQLETARALQAEFGLDFPLHLGTAEDMPFDDASFDMIVSEYGASIWCDPYLWIPEAARVLRPGGQLAILANSALLMLTAPDAEEPPGDRLLRPYFGMHRFEWSDDDSVEFHITHGAWIDLLRANGLDVEALIELQPHADAKPHRYPTLPALDWARRWPAEEIWRARKRVPSSVIKP
ncbi:MAG TPA: class I SAM-dependent methyltransferase [Dehalococcoidia bacterium]|nr:class I SAM-dependent methyltransferase [Dehalococcoidia bacterium]